MSHSSPLVAAIVVSYNTAALLRACLRSLRGCTVPLRVVVVDNASRDDSAAMVRSEFPEVELLALDHNRGFAGGIAAGLAWLEGRTVGACAGDAEPPFPGRSISRFNLSIPYVLILNPDTVVHPGAIEHMVAFLEAHPRVGLVGPRLLNPDGTPQPAAFRFPTLLMTALDLFPPGEALPGRLYGSWWHGRYPQERGEAPFPIDHPLGACMLTRAEVLATVGALDEAYFMYCEEIEWCWRIRRAGWAIWQVPAARVTHVGGAATAQVRWPMLVALWRSRDRFAAMRGPAWRLAAHRTIVRAGMARLTLRAWRAYLQGRIDRDELRARLLAYGRILRL
ncbi:MAG: glycosyltransferase family 2 protein [Chloroflexaceae bacterium]|nr:glycosyltransferase family 2 protein [Chloroflexaceae bacterium]